MHASSIMSELDCFISSYAYYIVPGDKSALNPSGIRLGTPALTTRGLQEEDIDKVVDFIHRGKTLGVIILILKVNLFL
jgi:glycine/serine hydroxymethyltransferase